MVAILHEGHTRAEVALGPEREPVWAVACVPHRERHVHGLPREDRAGRLGSHHPHTRHRFDFGDQRHHGHSLLADRRLQESPDDDVLVGQSVFSHAEIEPDRAPVVRRHADQLPGDRV